MKPASRAKSAEERPRASSSKEPGKPPTAAGSGPKWAVYIPRTASPRARSMPTSRPVDGVGEASGRGSVVVSGSTGAIVCTFGDMPYSV
ncbi:hypothetical protein GCM10010365_28840 [Streptomyces poonensis]|uniref:Uncharacterized protein n=1 Tax=Streptomyces poonensis TaxID=68255 RepID=A0A918PI02_9ACTN|nr:hypothetical protein GCM10010365_28840 [Streptomyces poonensis]GLJ88489.1 hypothetical protein GCM10017589_10890 [Streptomyces poonensis]